MANEPVSVPNPAAVKEQPVVPPPQETAAPKPEAASTPAAVGSAAQPLANAYEELLASLLKSAPDEYLNRAVDNYRGAGQAEGLNRALGISADVWARPSERLEMFLTAQPEHHRAVEAKFYLASCRSAQGKWDDAEKLFREYAAAAGQKDPKPAEYNQALFALAEASYQAAGTSKDKLARSEADLAAYLDAQKEGGMRKHALSMLADVKLNLGKAAEAEALYKETAAQLQDPADGEQLLRVRLNLGVAQFESGRQGAKDGAQGAIATIEALLKESKLTNPQDKAAAAFYLAEARKLTAIQSANPEEKLALYGAAAGDFESALAANSTPERTAACRNGWAACKCAQARLLSEAKKYEEAAAQCSAVIAQAGAVTDKANVNDALLVRGLCNFNAKKTDEAIADLSQFLNNVPLGENLSDVVRGDRRTALAGLAMMQAEKNDFPGALKTLAALKEEAADNPLLKQAAEVIGQKAQAAQNFAAAGEALSLAAEQLLHAKDVDFLGMVAAQAKAGKPEAQANFEKFMQQLGQDAAKAEKELDVLAAGWQVIKQLEQNGKKEEANRLLDSIQAAYPKSAEHAKRLWNQHLELTGKDPARAKEMLGRLLAACPEGDGTLQPLRRDSYARIADTELKLGNFEGARKAGAEFLRQFPGDSQTAAVRGIYARASSTLGAQLIAAGKYDEAKTVLTQGAMISAAQSNEPEPEAVAHCWLGLGDLEREKGVNEQDPSKQQTHYTQAENLYKEVRDRNLAFADITFQTDLRLGALLEARGSNAAAFYRYLLEKQYPEAKYPKDKFPETDQLRHEAQNRLQRLTPPAEASAAAAAPK